MSQKNALAFALVGAAVLVGLYYIVNRQAGPDESRAQVRLGSFSKAIDYAPYLVARNKKWFEEAAQRYETAVSYTEFQSLPPINEAFGTDNLDIVFEAEAPAIVGRAAGIDLKIMEAGVSLIQEIVVPRDSEVQDVKDLKGKKIAVTAGSSSHYGLVKILEQNGVPRRGAEIIDMVPTDAKAAFGSGQIDAWAVWPPFVEQEEVTGRGRTLRGGDVFIQSIVVVRGKFATEQPALLRDLLGAIERAQEWILSNEQEAQRIVAEELGLDLRVVERAWPKHNFNPPLGDTEIADIQAKADFLYEAGLVKRQIDVKADLVARP